MNKFVYVHNKGTKGVFLWFYIFSNNTMAKHTHTACTENISRKYDEMLLEKGMKLLTLQKKNI